MVGHTIAIAIAPSSQRLLIDGADDVKLSAGTSRIVHSLSQITLSRSLSGCDEDKKLSEKWKRIFFFWF